MNGILKWFADEEAGRQAVNEAFNSLPRADSNTTLQNVLNVLVYLVGVSSVIMILISGIKMTTSAGNPAAVTKAKQTLLYAIVGLLVALLSYAIINFVVFAATGQSM